MSYVSKYFKAEEYECRCGVCKGRPSDRMLAIADEIRRGWGSGVECTSGYRCEAYSLYLRMHNVPAAVHSAHNSGEAMDFRPVNGKIQEFQNYCRSRLVELDIYMESPQFTMSWCHLQTRKVKAPGRVFNP
jgi:hypothetical protein